MIDLSNEQLIPIREAPRHTPGRPHLSCFYRWMKRERCPLETVVVGGRRYTSVEAIHRFIERCSDTERTTPRQLSTRRRQEIERAEAECERHGI